MPTTLITGANRGLGLEFTRHYLNQGWQVHACCREPRRASQLAELAQAHDTLALHALDVNDAAAIDALAAQLHGDATGKAIDLLLNNAGVYGPRNAAIGTIDYDAWLQVLHTNLLAPMRVAEAFAAHVGASEHKRMVAITSKMGSISDNSSGGSYIYRSSKAALNAAFKSLAIDLQPRGIAVALLHPGWVKTDMGGDNALIDTQTSIAGMSAVIDKLTPENSGRFFNYDGSEIAW